MRLLLSSLALALLLAQPVLEPTLTARWEGQQARIAWSSDATLVCLYRETKEGWRYFLQCYTGGSGAIVLPWRDWTAHPAIGDTYIGDFDGVRIRAPLPSPVWLPVVREGETQEWRVFAPLVTAA